MFDKTPEVGHKYRLNTLRKFRCTDDLCDLPAVVTEVKDKMVTYAIGTYTDQHSSVKLFNKMYTPL